MSKKKIVLILLFPVILILLSGCEKINNIQNQEKKSVKKDEASCATNIFDYSKWSIFKNDEYKFYYPSLYNINNSETLPGTVFVLKKDLRSLVYVKDVSVQFKNFYDTVYDGKTLEEKLKIFYEKQTKATEGSNYAISDYKCKSITKFKQLELKFPGMNMQKMIFFENKGKIFMIYPADINDQETQNIISTIELID